MSSQEVLTYCVAERNIKREKRYPFQRGARWFFYERAVGVFFDAQQQRFLFLMSILHAAAFIYLFLPELPRPFILKQIDCLTWSEAISFEKLSLVLVKNWWFSILIDWYMGHARQKEKALRFYRQWNPNYKFGFWFDSNICNFLFIFNDKN
jgi:hypothetical protein